MAALTPDVYRDFSVSPKCLLCAEKAHVYWMDRSSLSLCRDCVLTILPRILADAIIQTTQPNQDLGEELFDAMQEIKRQFWSTALKTKGAKR